MKKKTLVGWTYKDYTMRDLLYIDDIWIKAVELSFQKKYLLPDKRPLKKVRITIEEIK